MNSCTKWKLNVRTRMIWRSAVAPAICLILLAAVPHPAVAGKLGFRPVQKLLDLSGLAWIEDDLFLAVHDAKFPDEFLRVRVSLLKLPASLDGIQWKPLRPRFPGVPSSDLESASGIPGTRHVLLVESGDDDGTLDRIFLATVKHDNNVKITDSVTWDSFFEYEPGIINIEGTAVAETSTGYFFIWAQRADGSSSTDVNWTALTLDPFSIGAGGVFSAPFSLPTQLAPLYNRPLVGLDVDTAGNLYAVTAYDPDSDDGPFRSAVLKIATVDGGGVAILSEANVIATQDGFKTESVTIQENGATAIFIGTDDENYGGTLRPIPTP